MDAPTPAAGPARLDGGLDISLSDLAQRDRYKLLSGVVIPRPIALVTTLSPEGHVNAAPYSFFNVFSEAPPLVVLGLGARGGAMKDTAANVSARSVRVLWSTSFSEEIAERMNVCAVVLSARRRGIFGPRRSRPRRLHGRWRRPPISP